MTDIIRGKTRRTAAVARLVLSWRVNTVLCGRHHLQSLIRLEIKLRNPLRVRDVMAALGFPATKEK